MVIAPSNRLEHLVAEAYGTASAEEFDIDFDIGADPPPTSRAIRGPMPTPPQPLPRIEPPTSSWHGETPAPLPPLPDMDALDPETFRLALTDLDDVRVTKDPAQSGQIPKVGGTLPPSNKPITTPPQNVLSALAAGSNLSVSSRSAQTSPPMNRASEPQLGPAEEKPTRKEVPPKRPLTFEMIQDGLLKVSTREAATDLVLSYVASRWVAGIVLAIRDKAAIGYRAHGVTSPESVTVSLGSPSTVQRAVQTRFLSIEAPSGVGQSALAHALNGPRAPAAAPIIVLGQPVAVLAVADPIEGPEARDIAAVDLAMLAEALGTAYTRILAR